MKRIVIKLFLFISFISSAFCYAQTSVTDSIHVLKEIAITSNRLQNFSSGNKIEQIDTNALNKHNANTLADLLADQSQVFIKSYGISSLATPSFRGLGADQTAVLWNGFNISSSMNGEIDFALIPVNFVDNVKLQFGGSGASWGTGAVGGTIHLNNISEFNKGITIGTTANFGSFGDKQQNTEFSISKKRFITSTKLFNHDATNDFPFINIAQFGNPLQKLGNAQMQQYGILQENYFKIKKNQQLSFRFWYQFNNRNIPASMTESVSEANQKDESYRSTLEWQLTKEKVSVFVRSAYFDESLIYNNPLISLLSTSRSKALIAEAESRIHIAANQSMNIGFNNTFNEAISNSYVKNPTRNRTSFFASYRINNKKDTWRGTASVRKEFISTGASPLTASAGFEGWIIKKFRLRGNVSRNYRLPTLNDLYWVPGGNPNLLPETGISEELGLAFILRSLSNFSLEAEVTAFGNNVNNDIIWLPNNYAIWTPSNVQSVWARGLEYDMKLNYKIKKVRLSLGAHYQFVLSTNEKINSGSDASLNKQLIYVPIQKAIANAAIEYKQFRLAFSYNYVGYRYTTSDNTQYLTPYQLVNVDVSKTFTFARFKLRAFAQINNLLNEWYQSIAYYPMPGRNFQIGISVNYNQPNKNTQ